MAARTRENQKFIRPVGLVFLSLAATFAILEAVNPGAALTQVTLVLGFCAVGTGQVWRNTLRASPPPMTGGCTTRQPRCSRSAHSSSGLGPGTGSSPQSTMVG